MRDTSVLVTGASGFIGSRLLGELRGRGARVAALSRQARGDAGDGVRWLLANLGDGAAVDAAFEEARPEVVFHLASWVSGRRELQQVRPAFAANLESAVNLLVAATRAGCRRVVLAGSMEAPDLAAGEPPGSPYAAAKAAQELYARFFRALYGTPVVIARIFMVYGPGQRDRTKVVPYAILRGLDGLRAELASGARPVDWIHVDDVARGLVALVEAPGIEGETLDLGGGETVSVGEIVARVAAKLGVPPPLLGARPDRPLETVRVADAERTFAATGFRPAVDLDGGLDSTIAWYRAERAAGRL